MNGIAEQPALAKAILVPRKPDTGGARRASSDAGRRTATSIWSIGERGEERLRAPRGLQIARALGIG